VSRLLTAVSAPQADEVGKMKMELRRLIFDEQVRGEKRKSAGTAIESQATANLKPWREVVAPHKDMASGRYQQAEFAAARLSASGPALLLGTPAIPFLPPSLGEPRAGSPVGIIATDGGDHQSAPVFIGEVQIPTDNVVSGQLPRARDLSHDLHQRLVADVRCPGPAPEPERGLDAVDGCRLASIERNLTEAMGGVYKIDVGVVGFRNAAVPVRDDTLDLAKPLAGAGTAPLTSHFALRPDFDWDKTLLGIMGHR
jgi:hypothetical protein